MPSKDFKLTIDSGSATPVFQQLVDQIHFAINTGELTHGDRLPSIRSLASEHQLATNTVAKAFRQLEFRGLLTARDRSGYLVANTDDNRYRSRGVSSDKTEVHRIVDSMDLGALPGAFCKVTEDYLSGDPDACNVIHADGSGTKSIIAYLYYKETGDPSVFKGISQDSIVMNLDDLLCIGTTGRILISNTINRNALNVPGEVVAALIEGSEEFLALLRDQGVQIYSGGGETADVGDLTGTVVVDSSAVAIMKKADAIANPIVPDMSIVGLSSTGQCAYENTENSGIGSNGLTSARHDMLHGDYGRDYPETYDCNVNPSLVYCGPWHLGDSLPNSTLTVGQALLSPTRSYAPFIHLLLDNMRSEVAGIIHCSGGAQTKCLKFGSDIHFVKDNLFPLPHLFDAIQQASETSWEEMYRVFNMGHRMEVYIPHHLVGEVIEMAQEFGIAAQRVGYTEAAENGSQLTLTDPDDREFIYR